MTAELKPVIALEGMDGTGKSTVANLIACRLGGAMLPSVPPELATTRATWEPADQVPANGRLAYYLSGVLLVSRRIDDERRHHAVVLDRWIASTLAYHEALGATLPIDVDTLGLCRPTLWVFLDCKESVRRERIIARGEPSRTDQLFLGPLGERARQAFARFAMWRIDTSNLTQHQVADQVVAALDPVGASSC